MEELLKELHKRFGAGPRSDGEPQAGQHTETAAPAHASKRLKDLYRAVVRRLHPDSQQSMTAQKTEWWHEAQTAYEAGNAERLEVILTLCEIDESGTVAHTSASLLQRITAQLKSSLREVKRQITERRHEPAWNFSKRTDHEAIAVQVRRELNGEFQAMNDRWMDTLELIAKWKAEAEKLNRTKGGGMGSTLRIKPSELVVGGRYLNRNGLFIREIEAIEGKTVHYHDQVGSWSCSNSSFVKACPTVATPEDEARVRKQTYGR